jgi:hypothetical protein
LTTNVKLDQKLQGILIPQHHLVLRTAKTLFLKPKAAVLTPLELYFMEIKTDDTKPKLEICFTKSNN